MPGNNRSQKKIASRIHIYLFGGHLDFNNTKFQYFSIKGCFNCMYEILYLNLNQKQGRRELKYRQNRKIEMSGIRAPFYFIKKVIFT